jgi:hypothetical protein
MLRQYLFRETLKDLWGLEIKSPQLAPGARREEK